MVAQMSCVHSLIALSLFFFFFFYKLLVIGISVSHISDSLFTSEEKINQETEKEHGNYRGKGRGIFSKLKKPEMQ